MANKNKIDKTFVSEIDKKLVEFDRTHPKSASQLAEIRKYERIYELRDTPTMNLHQKEDDDLWG